MGLLRRLARGLSWAPPTVLAVLGAAALVGCGQSVRYGSPPHFTPLPPFLRPPPLTDTVDNVHLGLAFDYHAHDARRVARSVDYIFGGVFIDWKVGFDPPVKHVDSYLPFDTDGYPQTIPGHSLKDWQARHPDWIVYRCDRKTPAYYGSGNTFVPLDFGNPAVQRYQVHEATATLAMGADGVAFDDFTFANYEGRCGVYRHRVWTPLGYPGRWQHSAALNSIMVTWLRNVSGQIHQRFPTSTFGLNVNLFVSGFDKLRLISPYADMLFDEAGFTAYGDHRLSDAAWQQEVAALEYLSARGKAFDVNGIVKAPNDRSVSPDEINWVLANYLLVKGAHSYTYIYAGDRAGFTGSPSGYGTFYDRPQYHMPIGHPTSNRFQSSGVQLRYYSGGLTIVNPSSSLSYTVPLDASYRDLFGRRYTTTITLPPVSGIVLLTGQ